jgi:hypothetical protein
MRPRNTGWKVYNIVSVQEPDLTEEPKEEEEEEENLDKMTVRVILSFLFLFIIFLVSHFQI